MNSWVVLRGISLFGPGLTLWSQAFPVLRGEAPWIDTRPAPPPPAMLSPNERRRCGLPARLALAVSAEATALSGLPADQLACVFASSNGEGGVVHELLQTLAAPDPAVSPTQFHNSVHNAVAGYWSIGTKSDQDVTCLACSDWTFASAMLQAVAACRAGGANVLLCVYDAPVPQPLGADRRTAFSFAAALVLSPPGEAPGMARIDVRISPEPIATDTPPRHPALAALVAGNAAARCLRLAETIALAEADSIDLALPDGHLVIEVAPC